MRIVWTALAAASMLAFACAQAQVTYEDILRADEQPHNWLTYSGTYSSHRHSLLTEITRDNVSDLALQWVFQVRSLDGSTKFEPTPLVVDGVMYTVSPPNDVVALDAATGRVFWIYSHTPSQETRVCCGRVNRGLAIHGDTLFMGTVDARLLAIDARTGRLLWERGVEGATPELGYSFTMAPLVVKDLVLIGPAGGEYGIRGWFAAFDVETGEEVWSIDTIPGPGEPGNETWGGDSWMQGGGPVWLTGSFDPELNLIYTGVGNPGPDWDGDVRPGDNLYTNSVLALDADTGEMAWYYQFMPHDEFDYDAIQIPVLVDMEWEGEPRKLMLWANRNGYFYVLDRTDGTFLNATPFTTVNWNDGFDDDGRPNRILFPTPEGTLVYPSNQGATNWYSPSYSPNTGLFYVPTWMDTYSVYRKDEGPDAVPYIPGQLYVGRFPSMSVPALVANPLNRRLPGEGYGAIQALDPHTGDQVWSFDMADVTDSGVLTTATDLVFAGGREGYFYALDAYSGEMLWSAMLGGQVASGPMSYAVDGRQYIAISAGNAKFVFALRE